jgi:hypothetical protein
MSLPDAPKPTTSESTAVVDPSAIARRVEAITDVVQMFGAFHRIPAPPDAGQEELSALFTQPRAEAVMISDNEIGVKLEFQFQAVKSGGPLDSETPERSLSNGPPPDLRIIVDAVFVVRYRLMPGPKPSHDELQRFGEVNSPLNVVPFWREFLDSSLRRAGMPPAMAPVHKVEPIAKPSATKV